MLVIVGALLVFATLSMVALLAIAARRPYAVTDTLVERVLVWLIYGSLMGAILLVIGMLVGWLPVGTELGF